MGHRSRRGPAEQQDRRPLVLTKVAELTSQRLAEREEQRMTTKVALVLPFVLIAVAPIIGRWRANIWLKNYAQRERAAEVPTGTLVETV